MRFLVLLTLFTIIGKAIAIDEPSQNIDSNSYCYSDDTARPQKLHFATKTAYQFMKGKEYEKLSTVPGCTPVKFWLFSRHGTRLPELDVIESLPELEIIRDEVINNYRSQNISINGSLCEGDLQLIRNWVLDKNITTDHEQYLVSQGWEDLKLLATDYQKVYPELLLTTYDKDHFLFRHSNTQRTKASYNAFTEGLFGNQTSSNITLDPIPEKDILLDPHDNCELFTKQNSEAKQPGKDIDKFASSELINQVIANVSARLGYNTSLTYHNVSLMYDMCRFEQAWYLDKPSAWCTAFTLEETKILEFYEDMKHQYKAGYVGKLNPNVPCALMQDMLKKLQSEDKPVVTAYFSHSTLMHLFFVALGAFKDKQILTADNYASMQDRQWRGSYMVPFAANVAVVKYNCSTNSSEPTTRLRFFLNQKPLELDGCVEGLCEEKDILSKYDNYLKADCSNQYCKTSSSPGALNISIIAFISSILYSVFHLI